MTPKFWIKQVAGTRDDGTASTVDFQPGLNTVIGPSNTGKTRIFKQSVGCSAITRACRLRERRGTYVRTSR